MARKEQVTINGEKFTFQSVSPRWYFELNDRCGMTGRGQRDTAQYMDELLKNVVVEPVEISAKGLDYFNDKDDIDTPEKLLAEIEKFFRKRR